MNKILYIKPLGKALYRGPGEFDMSSRGVHSYARSMFYPLPTTVVGVLIWIKKYMKKETSFRLPEIVGKDVVWINEYTSMLEEEFNLYGPFYKIGDSFYVAYDQRQKGLLRVHIDRYNKFYVNAYPDGRPSNFPIEKLKQNNDFIDISENNFDERIGIQLGPSIGKRKKIVVGNLEEDNNRGIYTVKFFHPESVARNSEISYTYFINLDFEIDSTIVRFGGEGGLANIFIEPIGDRSRIENVFNVIDHKEVRYIGFYVLSPILIPTKYDPCIYLKKEFFLGINELYIVGESMLLGVGFSSRMKNKNICRRPIYQAIKPGSLIYLKINQSISNFDIRKYSVDGVGIGSELGFGKLLPFIPIIGG